MVFSRMVSMNESKTNVVSFIGYKALFAWSPLGGSSAPHAGCQPPLKPRKRDGDAGGVQKPLTASVGLLGSHTISISVIFWETLWLFLPSGSCLSCCRIGVGDVSAATSARVFTPFRQSGISREQGRNSLKVCSFFIDSELEIEWSLSWCHWGAIAMVT